jgi:class 3 adenylate cyclase
LFADIAGFTEYSGSVDPEEVVKMLRELFTSFDKKSLSKNVYKLYTIGDCYVVTGVFDANDRQPA